MSDKDRFLLYGAPVGAVKVAVFFKDETVCLAEDSVRSILEHIADALAIRGVAGNPA